MNTIGWKMVEKWSGHVEEGRLDSIRTVGLVRSPISPSSLQILGGRMAPGWFSVPGFTGLCSSIPTVFWGRLGCGQLGPPDAWVLQR